MWVSNWLVRNGFSFRFFFFFKFSMSRTEAFTCGSLYRNTFCLAYLVQGQYDNSPWEYHPNPNPLARVRHFSRWKERHHTLRTAGGKPKPRWQTAQRVGRFIARVAETPACLPQRTLLSPTTSLGKTIIPVLCLIWAYFMIPRLY